MTNNFIPAVWQNIVLEHVGGPNLFADDNPQRFAIKVARPQRWLFSRRIFAFAWNALTRYGTMHRYLEIDSDGDLAITTDQHIYKWHPNPDYIPPTPGETVTFRKAGR